MPFRKGYPAWNKGRIGVYSEETKKAISEGLKKAYSEGRIKDKNGENHPMFGKTHTAEAREAIRKAKRGKECHNGFKKGQTPWNKGKSCPKISISLIGKKLSDLHIKKLSEARMGKEPWNKGLDWKEMQGENHPMWRGGTSYLPYCNKFNFRKQEEIRNKFDRKCFLCGKDEKENLINGKIYRLDVHHVDHDKYQGCNGKRWNLVPVCKSCHGRINRNIEYYKEFVTFILKLYEIKEVMKNWIM